MSERLLSWSKVVQEQEKRQLTPVPSPVQSTSLTESASPAVNVSPASNVPQAPQNTRLTESISPAVNASLAESTIDLWASITEWKEGMLYVPQILVQTLYRRLDPAEQAIYMQLFALSWGFGNPTCRVSLPKLADRAGMKQTAAHMAIKRLVTKGMVEKSAFVFGKGKDQGVEYSLPLPARLVESIRLMRSESLSQSVNNKIKHLNKAVVSRLTVKSVFAYPLRHRSQERVRDGCQSTMLW